MVASALHALLARSIDYAGLFPPARLALEPALENQAAYLRAPDAWMLNTFVLPVGQFNAAREHVSRFDSAHPLRISALGPKTDSPSAFLDALEETIVAIDSFARYSVDLISIHQLEMPLPPAVTVDLLNEARTMTANLAAFWEAPAAAAEETIGLLEEHNYNVGEPPFGYKLRTGGVTADAFPSSLQIARALVAPARHQLPIKFTAGLHHPVRQFRDEVNGKMHGFLNVIGAAVLAAEHRWNAEQTAAMLEDEKASAFLFDDQFFRWRQWKIETRRIEDRRRFVVSFGSCSFDEPRDDLRALKLL